MCLSVGLYLIPCFTYHVEKKTENTNLRIIRKDLQQNHNKYSNLISKCNHDNTKQIHHANKFYL